MKPNAPRYAIWVLAAAGLHAVILFVRWQFLVSGPSYSVAATPSIELSIVETAPQAEAAVIPPEPSPPPPEPPQPPIPPSVVREPSPPPPIPSPEPLPATSRERPQKSTSPPKPTAPRPRRASSSATRKPKANQSATQGGARSGSVGNSTAAYLYNPHPPYPSASRRAKEQGTVLLAVSLNERGKVISVSVRKSSGFPLLDQAARSGVAKWRFRPARMAGLPVSSQVEVPVQFRLRD